MLDAGTRYNIVANTAVIEGTVRAFSHENRRHAVEAVERIARQVASLIEQKLNLKFTMRQHHSLMMQSLRKERRR